MKFEPVVESRVSWLPWAALALVTPALFFLPVTHDAYWQIWLGRQMLGGAELYRDIIEVNPPLWFWIAEPLAALNLDPRLTVIGFFIGAMVLSLYLTPDRYRLPSLAVMLLVPLHDFGQREHFTLIATIPYVFASAKKPRHPIPVGIFAGVGFCLKPHFLLVPVVLAITSKKWREPQQIALAAFIALYALAIPIFAHAFITDGLPMARKFYAAFGATPNYSLLFLTFLLAASGALLSRREGSTETRALLMASLAFIPAVIVQAKGFAYHSVPVRGLLALAILSELVRERRNPFGDGLMVGAAVLCCFPPYFYLTPYRHTADRHMAGVRPGSSVVALVTNPSMVWPMVEVHHLNWQLHAMSVWQLNAAVLDPRLMPEVRSIYAPDLKKRPDLLIMDNRKVFGPAAHQLLPPGYLNCYRLKLSTGSMQSYRRVC